MVILKELVAAVSKTSCATSSVVAEKLTSFTLEAPKVATSLGPLGTVAGVQFVAVFQSPLVGLRFQVALPAKASSKREEVRIKKTMSLVFIGLARKERGVNAR